MKSHMQFACGTTLASLWNVEISSAVHSRGAIGACLGEGYYTARELSVLPGCEITVHPLQHLTCTIVTTVANVGGRCLPALVVASRIKVGWKYVSSAAGGDEGDLGWIIKVGQLRLELIHGLRPHGCIGRSNLHVNLAILQIGDGVNLTPTPGVHVGDWLGDGRVLIVHAGAVLFQ